MILIFILLQISFICGSESLAVNNNDLETVNSNINVQQTSNCSAGFIRLGEQCYQFNAAKLSWNDATKACQSMGATLAHPQNKEEDNNLVIHLMIHYGGRIIYWIDGNDAASEGDWRWYHDNYPIHYTNWAYREPDGQRNENCLCYWEQNNWAWNDFPCENKWQFICQQVQSVILYN
ncbi:Fc fragment of IgE, low affinity II, receptor for (CD23) [Chamberlinius hualienensis]